MYTKKLSPGQKEIVKIFQKNYKKKPGERFSLNRQQVSKEFFQTLLSKRFSGREKLDQVFEQQKQKNPGMAVERIKKIMKLDPQKEEWLKRREYGQRYMKDWQNRIGTKSVIGGTFAKRQALITNDLKSLIKEGYLTGQGSMAGLNLKPTQKLLDTDTDKK